MRSLTKESSFTKAYPGHTEDTAMSTAIAKGTSSYSMEKIRERAERHPFEVFDSYPVDEVRAYCLEKIKRGGYEEDPEWVADWFEVRIKESVRYPYRWDEPLCSAYLFMPCPRELREVFGVRAIEFFVQTLFEMASWHDYENPFTKLSKLLCGFIAQHPSLYWRSYSLREYFGRVLRLIMPVTNCWHYYTEDGWHASKRVIREIARNQDVMYLPQLEQILAAHELVLKAKDADNDVWTVMPNGSWPDIEIARGSDDFEGPMNTAFIRRAVDLLKQAQQKEQPADLNVLGSYITEKLGVDLRPLVRVEYPHKLQCIAGQRLVVRATLLFNWQGVITEKSGELTKKTDALREVVAKFSLCSGHSGEGGLLDVRPETGEEKDPEGNRPTTKFREVHLRSRDIPEGYGMLAYEAAFSMIPSRGMNRFRLDFETGESYKYLVRTRGYVLCE